MFCPNCGNKVEEIDSFCTKCGFDLKKDAAENQFDFKLQYDHAANESENIPTVMRETQADYASEPLTQIMEQPKNKKTAVKIIAAVLVVVIIAIGAFSAYYFTSEKYKIEKAENLISQGAYADAINQLSSLGSEQANTMRNYIILSQSVSQFKETCIGAGYNIVSGDYAYLADDMNNIISQIESFADNNDVAKLPQELNIEYNFYKKACESVKNIDLTSQLQTSQLSVVNVAYYGSKEKFTLDELKSRCDNSKAALAGLDTSLRSIVDITKKDSEFIDFTSQEFVNIYADYSRFIGACNDAVKSSEKLISSNKKTDSKTELYNKSGKDDFSVNMMHDLKPIGTTSHKEDIAVNAQIMNQTIQLSVFEYYLIYS